MATKETKGAGDTTRSVTTLFPPVVAAAAGDDGDGHHQQEDYIVEFDQSKGTTYFCCWGFGCWPLLTLFVGCICLPCLPCWARKEMESQECTIDEKRIRLKTGWITKQDKTIPLDRVQDITIEEGLLQRICGVTSLHIQTAGSSNADGAAEGILYAPKDAKAVRDAVMSKRDALVFLGGGGRTRGGGGRAASSSSQGGVVSDSAALLAEMVTLRESVQRMEKTVAEGLRRGGDL